MPSQNEMSDLPTRLGELFQRSSSTRFKVTARRGDAEDARKMWSIYMDEADRYDKAVTNAQKDDANGVLVFTGLFSAVVALFIVESYKRLSPDTGDTTTVLLKQISQQLGGLQNNTYTPPQDAEPFSPTNAILFVNALWLLSLVTAITAAFYVMLVQQWIRRYTQTSEELSSDQERVRTCLFLGTQKYYLSHAIGFIPLPLHISVFLFFSGLIIFLFTISCAMAIVVTVAVGFVGLLYIGLTILPIMDDVCPYFTPMSDPWWYLGHTFLSAAAFCFHRLLGRFRRPPPYSLDEVQSPRPDEHANWSEISEGAIDAKNEQRFRRGLRGNIFRHAQDAQAAPAVDLRALTWLLQRPAMAQKSNFQEFVDHIPPQTLVQLSSLEAESGERTIRYHLTALFRSCTHGTYKLDETVRNRRLEICLNAFHHIVKPFTLLDINYETILAYVWSNFDDIKHVQELWANSNPAIRVTSRSICAHLARNFLRKPRHELEMSELRWLDEVVGKLEVAKFDSFDPDSDHFSKRDHLNLQSFVFGVLSSQKEALAVDQATRFAETLAILMNAGSAGALSKEIFSEEFSSFIEWVEKCDHQHREEVVTKLREIFHDFFTETTP